MEPEEKVRSKKLNVTVREDLVARMDAYARGHAMSRSGLISIAVSQYLDAMEALPVVTRLSNILAAVGEGAIKRTLTKDEAEEMLGQVQKSYADLMKKTNLKDLGLPTEI